MALARHTAFGAGIQNETTIRLPASSLPYAAERPSIAAVPSALELPQVAASPLVDSLAADVSILEAAGKKDDHEAIEARLDQVFTAKSQATEHAAASDLMALAPETWIEADGAHAQGRLDTKENEMDVRIEVSLKGRMVGAALNADRIEISKRISLPKERSRKDFYVENWGYEASPSGQVRRAFHNLRSESRTIEPARAVAVTDDLLRDALKAAALAQKAWGIASVRGLIEKLPPSLPERIFADEGPDVSYSARAAAPAVQGGKLSELEIVRTQRTASVKDVDPETKERVVITVYTAFTLDLSGTLRKVTRQEALFKGLYKDEKERSIDSAVQREFQNLADQAVALRRFQLGQ